MKNPAQICLNFFQGSQVKCFSTKKPFFVHISITGSCLFIVENRPKLHLLEQLNIKA